MDERDRESREARQRLDDLRAETEMNRYRHGGTRGTLDSCLMNCGGTVALFAVAAAGIVVAVVLW